MWSIERKLAIGLGVVGAIIIVLAVVSYRDARGFIETARWVAHTHEVLTELDGVIAADAGMTDAGADV